MMEDNKVSPKPVICELSCTYPGSGIYDTTAVVSPKNQRKYKTSNPNTMLTAARLTGIIPEENEEQFDSFQSIPNGATYADHNIIKEIEKLGLTAQVKRGDNSNLKESICETDNITLRKSEKGKMYSSVIIDDKLTRVISDSDKKYKKTCLTGFDESIIFENDTPYLERRSSFSKVSHALSYGKAKAKGSGKGHLTNVTTTCNDAPFPTKSQLMLPYADTTMMRSSSASDIQNSTSFMTNTVNIHYKEDISLPDLWSSIPRTNSTSNISLEVTKNASKDFVKEAGLRTVLKDAIHIQHNDDEKENTENSETGGETDKTVMNCHRQKKPLIKALPSNITKDVGSCHSESSISKIDVNKQSETNKSASSFVEQTTEWTTTHKVKQSKREQQMLTPVF